MHFLDTQSTDPLGNSKHLNTSLLSTACIKDVNDKINHYLLYRERVGGGRHGRDKKMRKQGWILVPTTT